MKYITLAFICITKRNITVCLKTAFMNELPLNGFMFVKMKMYTNKHNRSDRLSFGVYDKKSLR